MKKLMSAVAMLMVVAALGLTGCQTMGKKSSGCSDYPKPITIVGDQLRPGQVIQFLGFQSHNLGKEEGYEYIVSWRVVGEKHAKVARMDDWLPGMPEMAEGVSSEGLYLIQHQDGPGIYAKQIGNVLAEKEKR